MQELFKAADIQPSATLKAWEPQRAYEKRLISIASKDPSIKSAAATKSKRKAPAVVEDEEDERDGEEAARDAGSPVPPRRRGPARVAAETSRGKSKTKAPVSASHVSDEGDNEDDDMEVEVEPSSLSEASGKRARDDEDGNDVPAEGEDERRRSPSGESDEVVVEAPRSMSVGSFDEGRPVKRTRRG
jgi:cohesin complex subunit SA-1/2